MQIIFSRSGAVVPVGLVTGAELRAAAVFRWAVRDSE